MSAPDWAALVQQTSDRIDQVREVAEACLEPDDEDFSVYSPAEAEWTLRMVAWAHDVLDRHLPVGIEADTICFTCSPSTWTVYWPCPEVMSVLRAWAPDLLDPGEPS